MRKTTITLVITALALLSIATTAFAATPIEPGNGRFGPRFGGVGCFILATDNNGEIVSRDTFEVNLDKAIADGAISADHKESFLEMFDYCLKNGAPAANGRGCGRLNGCNPGRGFVLPR